MKIKLAGIEAGIEPEIEDSSGQEIVQRQLELNVDDVNDIISALSEINFSKYIVLEDFHYLKQDVQKDFSIELKAFHESSHLSFVIVGVWLDENKLVIYNGDLTGRIIPINADMWSDDDLRKVVDKGAELLNIHFDNIFVDHLISECSGNVYIIQEACHRACRISGITKTQCKQFSIGADLDAHSIIQGIVLEQSGRYNAFITTYAGGFQETQLEMHKWLLYPVLISTADELMKGLSYRKIRSILETIHPRGSELNPGNVTQALKSVVSLQSSKSIQPIILDYDESTLMLHVVDRGFIIWLNVQNKDDLLALADLPTICSI